MFILRQERGLAVQYSEVRQDVFSSWESSGLVYGKRQTLEDEDERDAEGRSV